MPRKLLFIVNPNAGKKKSDKIIQTIRKTFPANIYYQFVIWKDKNNFDEIVKLLKSEGYTDAIAVGGDGTVNQVAKNILNSNITLGIIPIGSGNGLARTLGVSIDIEQAIKQIVDGQTTTIDSGNVNNIPFFCTSGIGFDAHIGNLFATSKTRGLNSYIKITFRELFKYRAKNYTLIFNNQTIQRKAFLITVANAGQYGNDFYIAPQANLQDGYFHVALLKPFNIIKSIGVFINILKRSAHLSSSIETFVTDKITIIRNEKDVIHFDGEPYFEGEEIIFENKPNSLKVLIGDSFKVA